MAATFDSVASKVDGTQPATLTYTVTLVAASNMAAIVTIHVNANTGDQPTIGAVSVGGVAATVVANSDVSQPVATAGNRRSVSYGVALGSMTGAQTVSIGLSGAGAWIVTTGCIVATGVDQSTPITNGNSVASVASPVNLAITSATGDLTVTAIGHNGTGAVALTGTGTTRRWEDHSNDPVGAGGTAPGPTVTHTWTTGGLDWDKGVVTGGNFLAAGAATDPGGPSQSIYRVRLRAF